MSLNAVDSDFDLELILGPAARTPSTDISHEQ